MSDHTITFTEEQVEYIREMGRRRQAAKTTEHKRANRDGVDIHIYGYAAECALALFLGCTPDTDIRADGGEKASLRRRGYTFDVKWRRKRSWELLYDPNSVPDVDVLVRAGGDLPNSTLRGWIERDLFVEHYDEVYIGRQNDPYDGLRWGLKPEKLRPMDQLTRFINGETVPMPPWTHSQPSLF